MTRRELRASADAPLVARPCGHHLDDAGSVYQQWKPDAAMPAMWRAEVADPCLVAGFYTNGEGPGLGTSTADGWLVPTQRVRGEFYQHFALAACFDRI
jgi:hypothetical protein